ncbi:MAG: hypothetical protein ACXVAP_00300 [Candidatus Limnocylindrales bacterium]
MRVLAVALWCCIVLACSTAVTPSASNSPPFPAVLSIDSRGGPPIVVKIGTVEVTRVACGAGAVVAPGDDGVPPLPWNLSIVKQSDGTVLLTSAVTELPKWVVLFGEEAGITSIAVAGPQGPPCPSGS